MCFFFFQAEDGIRDLTVTGVQTCALPISLRGSVRSWAPFVSRRREDLGHRRSRGILRRSEERREGKSVDLGGRRIIKKKKKHYNRCTIVELTIHQSSTTLSVSQSLDEPGT